jgi:L-ascorbate metabolism protein UlaG (beta-lactamase superfamily)
MTSRRSVLTTLGGLFVLGHTALADGRERRSRWELLFNSQETEPAPATPDPSTWRDDTITAAWIGHSTVLMNFLGTWLITDPVFSSRIGFTLAGFITLGPKRLVAPALSLDQVPPLDLILLSHAHMDHLDLPSLRHLNPMTPVVMAKNTADVIGGLDFNTVYELDWGQWASVAGMRIEALEVRHFGWRFPWEEDRSRGYKDGRSYNAYLLSRNGRHVVFGGDTSYHELFRRLGERHLEIEVAMMPIGAYDPWIRNHANPEQAVAMTQHMGARAIFPIHWNTFIQSDEPREEPIRRLHTAASDAGLPVALDTIGHTWNADGQQSSGTGG